MRRSILYAILPFSLILLAACNNQGKRDINIPSSENFPERNQRPPDVFFRAALDGDTGVISKYLDEGIAVNAVDSDTRTALMYAAYNGHKEILKMLLGKGASVDQRDFNGRTALMLASSGPFPEAVRVLLEHHADPDLYDREEHYTALMYAAAEGQLENVKILLEYKANPTIKDADGDMAITFARDNKHNSVVEYLEKR